MSTFIQTMNSKLQYLNPALRRIADYVLDNLERCKTITVNELATACEVADSTITRFVKEIGYSSFQQFKIAIAESLIHVDQSIDYEEKAIYENIQKEDDTKEIIEKVYHQNILKMTEAKNLLNIGELEKAVQVILDAETLIFVSTGSSSVATNEAIMRFTRAGKRCIFWNDASMQMMISATAAPTDVMIGISDSGKTKSVIQAIKSAKKLHVPTICVTSDSKSPLASLGDVILYTPMKVSKTEDQRHFESTTSKNAQILLMDIVYACFATKQYDQTITNLNQTYQALKATREIL